MAEAQQITLDIDTMTLGEMAAVEKASGQDFLDLWRAGRATRRLIGLYVHEYRTSETPRSWQELSALRLLDGSSSTSPESPAGHPVSVPA
jgi:hypothetical protein